MSRLQDELLGLASKVGVVEVRCDVLAASNRQLMRALECKQQEIEALKVELESARAMYRGFLSQVST